MSEHSKHGSMGMRGVSRPMAEKEMQQGAGHDHNGHEMTHQDRLSMLKMHHRQTLWIYWTIPLLGVWLLVSPASFGYLNPANWVDPSGGRGPWFAEQSTVELQQLCAWLMTASDLISGIFLLVFGWRALTPNRPVSLWICCFVGVWLTFAPILFWAPTPASYLNSSVVGILLIALTILIPGMPNMILYMQHGPPPLQDGVTTHPVGHNGGS